jgi:hypothetical protein
MSNRVTTSPNRGVRVASWRKACSMLVNSRAVLSLASPRASLTINGMRTPAWASTAESLSPRQFFWPVMDFARLVKRRHKRATANWKRVSSASKYFRTLVILFWLLARRCCAPVCNKSAAGRSMSFHRKRVWTQPSKSQKRVITSRSSERKAQTPALHLKSHVGDQGLPAVPSCGGAARAADNANPMLQRAQWHAVQLLQPSPLRDNGWGRCGKVQLEPGLQVRAGVPQTRPRTPA